MNSRWLPIFIIFLPEPEAEYLVPLAYNLTDATLSIRAVAFSNDGHWLATGSNDHCVRLYTFQESLKDSAVLTLVHSLAEASDIISAVAFSLDGRWLAVGSGDHRVRLYSMKVGDAVPELAHTFEDATDRINTVAFSGDGRWLATGSVDFAVRLYSLDAGDGATEPKFMYERVCHCWINSLAFSHDGKWMAVGAMDGRVRIYDLKQKSITLTYNFTESSRSINSVAFTRDSRWLGTGSIEGCVRIYNMNVGSEELEHVKPSIVQTVWDTNASIWAIAFSEFGDRQWLAAGAGDNSVRLYTLNCNTVPSLVRTLADATFSIWAVAFSADGRWFAAGCGDRCARLYTMQADIQEQRNLRTTLAFTLTDSADGFWVLPFGSIFLLLCVVARGGFPFPHPAARSIFSRQPGNGCDDAENYKLLRVGF